MCAPVKVLRKCNSVGCETPRLSLPIAPTGSVYDSSKLLTMSAVSCAYLIFALITCTASVIAAELILMSCVCVYFVNSEGDKKLTLTVLIVCGETEE